MYSQRTHPMLLAVGALTLILLAVAGRPQTGWACGSRGADAATQAAQAIDWAGSLVYWHASRRVATADPEDVGVRDLQHEAEVELAEAREQFRSGMFEAALAHAQTVAALLDN